MRPLPSDSTTQIVPVSAMPKLAPLTATGTERNLARRCRRAASAIAVASQPRSWPLAIVRSNSARISARFLWIAGTRMCDCLSFGSSWTISSARSVSIACDALLRQRLVEPDLVGGERLDLDHLVGAVGLRHRGHDRVRLGAVARPVHGPARGGDRRLEPLELLGSVAIARALIALPASRSASQSSSSAIVLSRLARIVVVALPRLRRSCESRRVLRAAAGKPFIRAPPGSRPGAPRARRCAGAAARRRCASGTSCRPTCRPRRRCRARGAACRRASPSRCRRS